MRVLCCPCFLLEQHFELDFVLRGGVLGRRLVASVRDKVDILIAFSRRPEQCTCVMHTQRQYNSVYHFIELVVPPSEM